MSSSASRNKMVESPASYLRNMQYMSQNQSSFGASVSPCVATGPYSAPSVPPLLTSPTISYDNDSSIMNTPLIMSASPSRTSPSVAGLSADPLRIYPVPTSALYPPSYQLPTQRREHVLAHFVNASSTRARSDRSTSHGSSHPAHLESFQLPSPYPTENVSVNQSYPRLRTPPVFTTTSALAAHHGIPQSLPPVPRTTKFASPESRPAPPQVVASSSTSDFDFYNYIRSNYLNMLSQHPEETQSAPERAHQTSDSSPDPEAVREIMHLFQASPEFHLLNDFNEFLTSPIDDSPFEEFLTTPAIGSSDMSSDLLTSPAIYDADTFPELGEAPLFAGLDAFDKPLSSSPPALSQPSLSFEGMYTMPSPATPALDPASLHPSPPNHPLSTPGTPARRFRKSLPTGTRRNITPDALVPLDAPVQQRKYVTPSATSRKEVPSAWLRKKRARSQAFGEEDELEEEVSLNPNDMDAIEAKRRQNTLAARRSRKRKLEYQRELETAVEREKEEKEMWRQRALLYQALLESHGHELPSLDMS